MRGDLGIQGSTSPPGPLCDSSMQSSSPSASSARPPAADGRGGSGRYGRPVPGEIPGGPKPIVFKGLVLNSKVMAAPMPVPTLSQLLMPAHHRVADACTPSRADATHALTQRTPSPTRR